ncbi:MAG: ISL3 family transposase, partial [Taibaiella sp.]|nr:ISL3 family transposase [Taibaiella sp.]
MEECPIYDHAPERKWRHLDTLQYKTYICCGLPRVKDREGKAKTIVPPWASKHERHTYLFEQLAIDVLLATKNQTQTANLLRCGFNVVNRIMHLCTERGMSRRDYGEHQFDHLSIDEKSFKKGHQYVSVLSSPKAGCVMDVAEGRTKESVKALLDSALSEEQQASVKTMSMDMWKAFISVTKEKMPNAEIVHDRFHLIKYLNEAIDKVRRREVKIHEELRNSRYALLKNKDNLTEKQRLKFEAIEGANYEVGRAWHVRESFKDLYALESEKPNAFILFTRWAQNALNKKIKEVSKVVEMFQNHLSGVVNALVSGFNNAMAERLNGKIQEVKLSGRGYRTFKNFRSAILFFHGGLDLYPLK